MRTFLSFFCLFFLIFFGSKSFGQTENDQLQIRIKKAKVEIILDGKLDEAAWQEAEMSSDFHQNSPFDTCLAKLQTKVRLTFDDEFFYVGAIVYEPQSDYIIQSLKRDFEPGPTDVVAVNIDPFKDKLNAFHFALSPFNVQREGLINNGSTLTGGWDNKWYSAVHNTPEYWSFEMAIPFKTLRYRLTEGQNTWRINFARNSVKANELSSWGHVPRQFGVNNIGFSGLLIWEEPPPRPGLNVSLIPFATARAERDQEFKLPTEYKANVGFDAKIAITPSLNLDLTFNPDFSQVEVDRQITNLSRFELFFPERRQFFIENEDLFSKFGFPGSRPFFSRRIGLANGTIVKRTTDGDTVSVNRNLNVPIIAGARLSGKLDDNWRIGLLNMQTAKVDDIKLNPANYSVGIVQRRIFERSYIGAVVVNKENFLEKDGGYSIDKKGYNRVVGLEYNLLSPDNKWEGEFFYHRSISAQNNDDAQAAAIFLGYYTRHWNFFFPTQYIGRNHRADMGFVPRRGFYSISPGVRHRLFPKSKWWSKRVLSFNIGADTEFTANLPDFNFTDRLLAPYAFAELPGNSELYLSWRHNYTYLFFSFDPTNSGGLELPEGSEYTYNAYRLYYNSDLRKDFYFDVEIDLGEYFNGNIFQVEGTFNYRFQPYGVFAISYAYNDINLPAPYNDAKFWLVGPRAELSFSRSLFLSAFWQYNAQANNINFNGRLQWRFLPVSDLFLVYTDNYFSDQFFENARVKNRALVLKVTYWLNL